MELQKTEQQKKDLQTFIQKKTSAKLKINDCVNAKSINKMKKHFGEKLVEISVAGILIKYMALFNVKYSMNDLQIEFFASQFIEEFGNESIDDLIVCLRNSASGKYGEIYSAIDPATVFKWFRIHLDEKYQAKENLLQRNKITMSQQLDENPVNKELNKEWCKKIRDELDADKPKAKTLDEINQANHESWWFKVKPHMNELDHEYLKTLLTEFEKKPERYTEEINEIKKSLH